MRQAHHGGDTGEARHFIAAQGLVKNLVHVIASALIFNERILRSQPGMNNRQGEILSSGISKLTAF
jgi:hypothetical protein